MILTPKPRADGTPRSKSNPNPVLLPFKFRGEEPQMTVTLLYIWHAKLGMTYINDARVVSLNIICHHRLQAWETNGGNWAHLQATGRQGPYYQILNFRSPDVRQQAAHDTLPQALQHDLMMTALLKQTEIHWLTKRKI